MDNYEAYRSPSVKAEPRWVGRDDMDRPPLNDSYRSRRSPGMQERRGGARGPRNRSRSPVMIDRYQPPERLPRDDFYGQSREHASRDREDRRRASSPMGHIDRYVPGQNTGKPPIRVNPLPNPLTLDFQVGFNWFAEWWRVEQSIKEDKERHREGGRRPSDRAIKGDRESREEREKERAQIQMAYDAYKEELQVKMARTFVQQHKGEEWFKERYFPDIRDPFHQRLTEFRRGALSQWENDVEAGSFDEFTLEGIYKTESNGIGGIVEREEGETVAAAEVLGVGDLVPSRGGDIRDESALQPALLIKTLAPMVSRERIEDFCKEHLGEDEGGFKWLSLSDPNPLKKCHRIGWIMLHPSSEVPEATERGDGREEENEENEVGEESTIAEPKGMLGTAEKALEAINSKTIYDETRGDFTCHVGVHVPPREPRKKALWDLFSAPERIDRDLDLAKRLVWKFDQDFGSDVNGVGKVEQRVEDLREKGWLQAQASGPVGVKKEKKSQQVLGMGDDEMEDGEDQEEGEEEEEEEEGAYDEEIDSEELLVKKKTLDLLVEYLRRVYNFCFFCVFESDSIHELIRKCPGGHLRRPRASLSSAAKAAARASASGLPFPIKRKESSDEGDGGSPVMEKYQGRYKNDQQLLRAFNWVKTFEEKILQILEPENVDVKKLGGKPVEEGLDEELKKYVKQEDEAKFRCKVPECTKLFKGDIFWRKHVEKRHPEWFEGIKKDLNLVNTYVLDPSHIAPSRSDANSNGHFPMNNHNLTAGTPRGFNLANMPMMASFPPGFPPPTGFPAFPNFGTHTVQAPGSWASAAMTANPEDMHQPGAMRRGGGRFSASSRPGPYDRRQPRFGSSGRLTPPRNGMQMGGRMGAGGAGKWGDGAGAQTVGPREAVQGRSLKSYEDLDAVGGGGSGELNY
ncbi:hypothetical protein MMC12_004550 [Toensbergia leucococca]|nr:hypothetical protein [Toensbergia leucococca]